MYMNSTSITARESDPSFCDAETSLFSTEVDSDRRKSFRYTVNQGTYAVLHPMSPQICQILDISKNGMAFLYFEKEGNGSFKTGHLDVLVSGTGFCVEDIAFEKVEDYPVDSRDICGFQKRVAHVRFCCINPGEQEEIDNFMRQYYDKTLN